MTDKPIRDDLALDIFPQHGEPIDPVAMARRDMKKALPKRFYEVASVRGEEGLFVLTLDGRVAKTPAKNKLGLPTQQAAEALAVEWQNVKEHIDPLEMPITRIVNSALDGVFVQMEATLEEIVKFAGSDLLCYRAGEPQSLVEAQAASWDPILANVQERICARFVCAEGVMFVAQSPQAIEATRQSFQKILAQTPAAPIALATLHVVTTLTGSALIALALALGEISAEQAWAAAHVDEDFQIRIWGADHEALQRRARRWTEMEAAARLFGLIRKERI